MDPGQVCRTLRLSIAGVTISVSADEGISIPRSRLPILDFAREGQERCSIQALSRDPKGIARPGGSQPVFDSGGTWSLHRLSDGRLAMIDGVSFDDEIGKALVIDDDFRSGELYCGDPPGLLRGGPISDPLSYPFDQLIMMQLLSRGIGVMMHASGIVHDGCGILFAGDSGRGKTTMATIWHESTDARILNDDRIVIRRAGSGYSIFGTPWFGSGRFWEDASAHLTAIYLIGHGAQNESRSLSAPEAAIRLASVLFAPYWDRPGMEYSLGFCTEIVQTIPVYELDFIPDRSVITYLAIARRT